MSKSVEEQKAARKERMRVRKEAKKLGVSTKEFKAQQLNESVAQPTSNN